jgi:hypothetical protein
MECVEALGVRDVGISPSGEQQMHDVEVTIPRRPLQRRRLELSSDRVHIGSVVEKPPAGANVSVDRCPMQRGHVLRVALGEVD